MMVTQTQTHKPFQLLIADDHASFRSVLREVLQVAPRIEVIEAESGEEAVQVARHQRIDVVLLDMYMHEMTGLEALRELKCLDAARPCIIITSEVTEALRVEATDADAHTVLAKPVRRDELVTTVSDAIAVAYDEVIIDEFLPKAG